MEHTHASYNLLIHKPKIIKPDLEELEKVALAEGKKTKFWKRLAV